MDIQFTDTSNLDIQDEERKPYRASKVLPTWYKQTPSYLNGNKKTIGNEGTSLATIKRCMPVFDALTAGYIIPTVVDVYVTQKNGAAYYNWPSGDIIEFHNPEQAELHPKTNTLMVPKWMNPWSIKTPKGYSTLFTNPLHGDNPYFTIFPGIVDTDVYQVPVNFPFVLTDPTFEGLIPAGTPIAQVIPIKREPWNLTYGSKTDAKYLDTQFKKLRSVWFDAYKRMFRQPKPYN